MYVCCCEGITDSQIKKSIENGEIFSFNELRVKYCVGNNCGKCLEEVREIFNDSIKRKTNSLTTELEGTFNLEPSTKLILQ
tara:strand:+ start:292 stop:534 length:243 start_codon:yes stop_codon:yes gene_type:complete